MASPIVHGFIELRVKLPVRVTLVVAFLGERLPRPVSGIFPSLVR
jgi:hypothetical protein